MALPNQETPSLSPQATRLPQGQATLSPPLPCVAPLPALPPVCPDTDTARPGPGRLPFSSYAGLPAPKRWYKVVKESHDPGDPVYEALAGVPTEPSTPA